MRYFQRILICAGVGTAALVLQTAKAAEGKLSPPLQRFLDGKQHLRQDQILNDSMQIANASRVCSVPLVEMQLQSPERFKMRTATAVSNDRMPSTTGPAPPCPTRDAQK